jgi:ABC-type glycerol-3-phosphate transport system substrate-binding protein
MRKSEAVMKFVRWVVAVAAAVVMLAAASGTAAGDPPAMTHNSILPEMTHN